MFSEFSIVFLLLTNALTGVSCYYLGHRGLSGVQNDLKDVKTDLAILKLRMSGQTPTPPTPGLPVVKPQV